MPLYEYKCHLCGQTFEVMQKFSDQALRVHEHCGGQVERLLSPPALQFKGSGWYVTDYAGNNGKKPAGTEGKKDDKKESPGDSKPESKTPSTTSSQSSDTKV